MLKINSGQFRSRLILGPPDMERSRPMPSRVKESLFNLLRGWFEDARVLDLFAGVGTVGLEAVSHGASEVFMFERDREIHAILQANIAELDCGDHCRAVLADALGPSVLAQAPRPVDIVFMDPPYAIMAQDSMRQAVLAQASRLHAVMADKSWLVLRTPEPLSESERVIEGLAGPEVHQYAEDMHVHLYFKGPDSSDEDEGRSTS